MLYDIKQQAIKQSLHKDVCVYKVFMRLEREVVLSRGDVFILQHFLGHATLQMTQRYLLSLSDDDAVRAQRRFSTLDNMNLAR